MVVILLATSSEWYHTFLNDHLHLASLSFFVALLMNWSSQGRFFMLPSVLFRTKVLCVG